MDTLTKLACPSCGNEQGLYMRVDCLWNPLNGEWEIGDMEEVIDCTECDEVFYPSECAK